MVRSSGSARRVDAAWLLAVGLLSSAWCLAAAAREGVTFDEPFYVKSGLHHWRTGSNKPLMSAGTMPLPVDAVTLPIYLWERWRGVPFDPLADLHEVLPVARATNLAFWWLLLGYGMALGRAFGGPWAGRAALALLATEPNLLAHAGLATTDIAVTAGVFAATLYTHRGIGCGWGRRVAVPGAAYGVAVLAKGSALAFVPIIYPVLGLLPLARSGALAPPPGLGPWGRLGHLRRATSRLRWDALYVVLLGLAVVFAYCWSDFGTEWTFIEWAEKLPEGPLRQVMLPLSENLRIFPNAGEGLLQQVKHNVRGHGAFLLGDWYPRAIWYYFPVALTAKLTLSALALLAATLALRPRAFFGPAGWVAAALFLFSLNCRVQIGIRLVFPLVGFLLVALAAAAFRRPEGDASGRRRSPFPLFAAITVVGQVVAAAAAWPDGLRYSNRLWGGPDRTYESLSDSNSDWGQGLNDLAEWNARGGDGSPVGVWYYGTDPAAGRAPFRLVPLHCVPAAPEAALRAAHTRFLAVGSSILYGNPDLTPVTRDLVAWLRARPALARTNTFFVYDLESLLPAPPPAAPGPAPAP